MAQKQSHFLDEYTHTFSSVSHLFSLPSRLFPPNKVNKTHTKKKKKKDNTHLKHICTVEKMFFSFVSQELGFRLFLLSFHTFHVLPVGVQVHSSFIT